MSDITKPSGDALQTRLHAMVSQWSQGKVSLKQIVGLSDDELYAISSQAYFLFLQGKIDQARVMFEGLVAIDPRNAYYYRALGTIYWRLKDSQKALKQMTYAIRVAPNDVATYINRAEVYVALKQFPQAQADLQHALRHASNQDEPLVRKAKAILQMIR